MTRFLVTTFAVISVGISASAAQPSCPYRKMTDLDFSKAEAKFRRSFCSAPKSAPCDTSSKNVSDLMTRLSKDPRILNVASASYILATVYLETGSQQFSPRTVEKIGPDQKKRKYYPAYIGRGWVQLTYEDKYALAGRALHIDLLNQPELALDVENSYEILVRSMTEGWLETYRLTKRGGGVGKAIKLGDFITDHSVNYGQARAIINANCMGKRCNDEKFLDKGFLPRAEKLDNGKLGEQKALVFQDLICSALP